MHDGVGTGFVGVGLDDGVGVSPGVGVALGVGHTGSDGVITMEGAIDGVVVTVGEGEGAMHSVPGR